MNRKLKFTDAAREALKELKRAPGQSGRHAQVVKILHYMETNLRHPSLKTHEIVSMRGQGPGGEKVWQAYAQNDTPGAYRILFSYGNEEQAGKKAPILWIIEIVPHL